MVYYLVPQVLYWATISAVIAMGAMCIGLFVIACIGNRKSKNHNDE